MSTQMQWMTAIPFLWRTDSISVKQKHIPLPVAIPIPLTWQAILYPFPAHSKFLWQNEGELWCQSYFVTLNERFFDREIAIQLSVRDNCLIMAGIFLAQIA